MEIYSFVSTKGGVGKTSIAYNFATYLSERDNYVLVIDQDHQCSISQLFDCDKQQHTDNLNISQYDYIIIDTHPDFRTATRNAVAVSDKIISPDVPGANNDETKGNTLERYSQCVEEIIDPISMQSYVTAELYLVGNRIKHNTESSRRFVQELEEFDNYLTSFKEKELFIRATVKRTSVDNLMKLKENQRKEHIEFYNQYQKSFKKFLEAE